MYNGAYFLQEEQQVKKLYRKREERGSRQEKKYLYTELCLIFCTSKWVFSTGWSARYIYFFWIVIAYVHLYAFDKSTLLKEPPNDKVKCYGDSPLLV